MLKKLTLLFLCISLLLLTAGCTKDDFNELTSSAQTASKEKKAKQTAVLLPNPLTGKRTLTEEETGKRPVAIMINNISTAQSVQCGLNDADIVFECLVEGGISRLMAVYYDVAKAGQIGSVRSARYTYVQLARGLNAVYVHCGSDQVYTLPYMRNIGMDDYDLGQYSNSCFRENNGLAWEHRLYTSGELLSSQLSDRTGNQKTTESVFTFADETKPMKPEASCQSITYAMSASYRTTFRYDTATGQYTRNPSGSAHKDYKSGETTKTDNVFVLFADSPLFDDGYHLRTLLSSGSGLYATKGGYQEIQWKKGDADAPLVLTDQEGKPLTVNPGTSWIAFAPNNLRGQAVTE